MADNVAITAGAGTVIATDDVSGVQFQRVKLDVGGDGVSVPVVGELPVSLATLPALTTGAAVIGSISNTSFAIGGTLPAFAATPTFNIGTLNGAATDATLALQSAKLPASVGAKTGAASLSVVPASDGIFSTIADNYARVIASNTVTRPANTTAYAAGQVVGNTAGATGRFTFASIARSNAGAVRIDRMRLYKSQATAVGSFVLWIYRADPVASIPADQAATTALPVGNAGATVRLVGRVTFDMTGAAIGSDGAEVSGIPTTGPAVIAQCGAGSANLFGVLTAAGAYTPQSGETFSVVAEAYAF